MGGFVAAADQLQEAVFEFFPAATSSTVPAAHTRPLLITATCVHIFSTNAITCEEIITVPPVFAYSMRMSLRLALDTGSTDSNGSSRTRMRGL